MQKIVVAGGAGFIGSHLSERLLDEGNEVLVIDNLSTSSKQNIEGLQGSPQFTFIEFDLTKPIDEISERLAGVNKIYHLASPASPNPKSPRSYINFPIETLLVNSVGTYNLLQVAKTNNARLLYASTSEVYGDPTVSPQPEEYWGNVNPNGMRSVYDEGKRFGEAMVMGFKRKFGMDTRIIRIFNTYGPRMQKDDGRVVSNLINQAISGSPLTVYGDGSQTRSFCYVSDLVDGIIRVMDKENQSGIVVNLGNATELSVKEIAEKIKALTGSTSEITYEPLPEDDPKQRRPDLTRAREVFGYEPKISLDEGLQKTIEYFKNA